MPWMSAPSRSARAKRCSNGIVNQVLSGEMPPMRKSAAPATTSPRPILQRRVKRSAAPASKTSSTNVEGCKADQSALEIR